MGDDDDVWEWIYQGGAEDEEEEEADSGEEQEGTTPRKRKRKAVRAAGKKIVGARRGEFECKIGDTVLVTNENGTDWVAIIYQFFEDENNDGDKSAYMMCNTYTQSLL